MFYNDNKASFQQFVQMMQNERDRQYQEDMLLLAGNIEGVAHAIIQNKQTPVDDGEQELTTQTVEGTPGDDTLQQNNAVASTGSEYKDNGHGALRLRRVV